jgi:hypothetical protein
MKTKFTTSILLMAVFTVLFLRGNAQLITTQFGGYTQNMNSEEAKELHKRTLLVSLNEGSESDRKALQKKKKSIEEYMLIIENDNAALKNAVEKHWKFTTFKFMPDRQARDLMKKEPEKYAVLAMERYIDYDNWGGWNMQQNPGGLPNAKFENKTQGYVRAYTFNPTQWISTNEITELRLFMPKKIFSVGLPRKIVTEADAIYGIKQLQFYCNRLAEEEKGTAKKINKSLNGKVLKEKTLLLSKVDVDEKLTESDINKEYTSQFKLVNQDEIDKAVIDERDVAIVQIISAEGGKGNVSLQYIVNAGTGEIYGILIPNVAFRNDLIKWNQRIKKKQLGDFEDVSNGK